MNCRLSVMVWAVALCLQALPLRAQVDESTLKLGFEPTATNEKVWSGGFEVRSAGADALLKKLLARMPGSRQHDATTLEWKGMNWDVGIDPGVVEVRPPPMHLEDIIPMLTPLYDAFPQAGLEPVYPGTREGSGSHIHVEKQVFVDNPLLLRNLIVDVHNRPYLRPIFRKATDFTNAQSIFELGEQENLRKGVEDLDALARSKGRYEYADVLAAFEFMRVNRMRDVNLQNLWSDGPPTVEFRFFSRQKTPQDIYDQAKFLVRHLKRLEAVREPLPMKVWSAEERVVMVAPARGEAEFGRLVKELGLDVKSYRRFLSQYNPGDFWRARGQMDLPAKAKVWKTFRTEASGLGKFGAAYLVKEGAQALAAGDPERIRKAAEEMTTKEFWGSVGLFTIASRGTERLMETGPGKKLIPFRYRGLAKMGLSLTVGMGVLELASGKPDGARMAVSTGTFFGMGMAAMPLDAVVKQAVSKLGWAGKIAAGAYEVSKLAAMLGFADAADQVVTGGATGR